MAKKILGILLIILLVLETLLFSVTSAYITGKTTNDFSYSYTKAICTSTNYCQDFEITCSDEGVIEMSPITGAVVQFSSDWKDPRNKEDIERTC